MMSCDSIASVTPASPGQSRDGWPRVTEAQPIIVTCYFPGGNIAVIHVYEAEGEAQAVSIVQQRAFPGCRYIAAPDDPTGGRAVPFYMWVCNENDRQQAQAIDRMRTRMMLQIGASDGDRTA